jgi:glycosyltransferase involved in cell wall biosynthesis
MLGDNGGILVDPEDVEGLASTLFHVVNDSDARTRYGTQALQRIEQEFNLETAADRIDKIYHRITERREAS